MNGGLPVAKYIPGYSKPRFEQKYCVVWPESLCPNHRIGERYSEDISTSCIGTQNKLGHPAIDLAPPIRKLMAHAQVNSQITPNAKGILHVPGAFKRSKRHCRRNRHILGRLQFPL